MKDLCFVAYVFGEKYQEYIPLFVLSALKAYPDYDVRIYVDKKLDIKVKNQMEVLQSYTDNFAIIEDFCQKTCFSRKALRVQQIQKSQRWLFYDEAFKNYNAIYIGDIDLLICPEEMPIYEQHIIHCNHIHKPYSNISRKANKNKKIRPKIVLNNIVKYGLNQTIKYYKCEQDEIIKLSGLHFVKTDEYFKKVVPLFSSYINELNLLAEGKSEKYNLCMYNNESMLMDLMIDAGFGTPELANGYDYNIETNPRVVAYRPHHGLHLGIFRSEEVIKVESTVVNSDVYIEYYKSFLSLKRTPEYISLSKMFSVSLNQILDRMDKHYSKLILEQGLL